jgi:nucleotide-binding universal stress UspA family protein
VALDRAIELAKTFGGSLTLVHAVVPPEFQFGPQSLLDQVLDQMRTRLQDERHHAVEAGVANVEVVIAEGSAARQIVKIARSGHHDLIVLGTHGRTGIDHLAVGSVAERVVRHAGCAVLVVPQAEGARGAG